MSWRPLEELQEATNIAHALGIHKPTMPTQLGRTLSESLSFYADFGSQPIPLYFMGTEALKAEYNALLARENEDLYAPYRPKRRTRAQIAIEAGLQPLADTLLDEVHAEPEQVAEQFLRDKPFDSIKAVLDGARDILAERFAEDADLRAQLRDYLWQHGWLYAQVVEGKEQEGRNFRDWFDFSEPVKSIPSHRLLAILRGRSQDILRLRLGLEPEKEQQDPYPTVQQIAQFLRLRINLKAPASPREQWLAETCRWTWRVRMLPTFETEIVGSLREQAEQEAIRVFAENLRDLLLAAPAGYAHSRKNTQNSNLTASLFQRQVPLSIRHLNWQAMNFPIWMYRCAGLYQLPADCRIRWQSWSKSNPRP